MCVSSYYDAIYVHWPTSNAVSKDATCNAGASYNATSCRLHSWSALIDIFNAGQAKSIGVSNYNASQMAEIIDSGMLWPSILQNPIHLYRSSSQMQAITYAQRHGIVVNAYSPRECIFANVQATCTCLHAPPRLPSPPHTHTHTQTHSFTYAYRTLLVARECRTQYSYAFFSSRISFRVCSTPACVYAVGVPDWHVYPAPMSPTELQDPLVVQLAAKYGKSAAQVLIGWLWQGFGITCNPRTLSVPHMIENLNAFEHSLTDGEVSGLLASPQDWCTLDSGMYECAPAP